MRGRFGEWGRGLIATAVLFGLALVVTALGGDLASVQVGGESFPLVLGLIGTTPLVPRTFGELKQLAFPQSAQVPELIPHIIWDTLTYTSGTTTQLIFFRTAQGNPRLGNMLSGGMLQAPQWFEIHNLGFDILIDATTAAGGETGALDDVAKLMLVGSPTFQLVFQDKNYGPYPLSHLHGSGGPAGVGYGTFTAEESIQVATNSYPDGGWDWKGRIVIPPMANFNVTVDWNAAQTLASGNSLVRFWMYGGLYRSIK